MRPDHTLFQRVDQFHRRHRNRKVAARLRLDAERLQREGALESADKQVGAPGDDARLGGCAKIVAGKLAIVILAGDGQHRPLQGPLMGDAKIDPDLGDDACVVFPAAALGLESAGKSLVRGDDQSGSTVDLAGEQAELHISGGAGRGSEKGCGERGGEDGSDFLDHRVIQTFRVKND
jgi:hypothetical protein